jgi:hypothetical protein
MWIVLTIDDFEFIITAIADALQDILQKHEAKKEEMYDRIEVELRGEQQAIKSSHAVSTTPPTSEAPELGDDHSQLRRLADATEACLRRAQEETEHTIEALKQVQKVVIEKCRVLQQEKVALQTKFE